MTDKDFVVSLVDAGDYMYRLAKEYRESLEKIQAERLELLAAWDKLSPDRYYNDNTSNEVQNWLFNDMQPVINKLRTKV